MWYAKAVVARCGLAPAKFSAQRLGPGHREVAQTHREAALDHYFVPVPAPPTPAPAEFESPTLTASATRFPPEVACHP